VILVLFLIFKKMPFFQSHCNIFCIFVLFSLLAMSFAQLSSDFYGTTCPKALSIINSAVCSAVSKEHRMGASLLRLHFHDCFVNVLSFFSLRHARTYKCTHALFICPLSLHEHACLDLQKVTIPM
jgi:hypothetical protein